MADETTPKSRHIAIVGSLGGAKNLGENPAADQKNREMAHAFGEAFAERGYKIVAYTSSPLFVELPLVRGYLSSGKATEKSVRVISPANDPHNFSVNDTDDPPQFFDEKYFERIVDPNNDWKVSYFSSLGDADGILMIGGQIKTRIVGVLCLENGWPILAIRDSGGSARDTWDAIEASHKFKEEDANLMGLPFRPELMPNYIQVLESQIVVKETAKALAEATEKQHISDLALYKSQNDYTKQSQQRSFAVLGLLAASILSFAAVSIFAQMNKDSGLNAYPVLIALLFCSAFAGALGGVTKTIMDRRVDYNYRPSDNVLQVIAMGSLAGFIAGMLYVSTQVLAGASNIGVVSITALFVGIIGGLTTEKVFSDLEKKNALDTSSLVAEASKKDSKSPIQHKAKED